MLLGPAKLYPWPVLQKITVMMNNLLAIITIDLDPHFQIARYSIFFRMKEHYKWRKQFEEIMQEQILKEKWHFRTLL